MPPGLVMLSMFTPSCAPYPTGGRATRLPPTQGSPHPHPGPSPVVRVGAGRVGGGP